MKPQEGRRRVIVEEIQPQVDAGRYPAKRCLGDIVRVTAAVFGDGHDHVAGRVLYRHSSSKEWQSAPFSPLVNDLFEAEFPVDKLGTWYYTVEGWVDHFDTWVHDLGKRLAAQPDTKEPTQQVGPQDIPLALRIGASHLDDVASRATGEDAATLATAASVLRALADANHPHYAENPITDDLLKIASRHPNPDLVTRYASELPLWVDRERARFSAWYELFPRSCGASEEVHGTLRDVITRLPEIAGMGFDIVYMPPSSPHRRAVSQGQEQLRDG